MNGIGDACQTPQTQHSTAGFLQALLNGGTTAQPTGLSVEDEPEIMERLVRIVDFRVASGLTDSARELTQNLVDSLVAVGLVSEEDAEDLVDEVAPETTMTCDVDGDGDIDRNDLNLILARRNQPATGPGDPADANGDGIITVLDARLCVIQIPR